QRDGECRSATGRTRHGDRAAVRLDETPRQGETEAGSSRVRTARVELFEFVEDAFLIFGANADAVIDDVDAPAAIRLAAANGDLPPFRRAFVRVRELIE